MRAKAKLQGFKAIQAAPMVATAHFLTSCRAQTPSTSRERPLRPCQTSFALPVGLLQTKFAWLGRTSWRQASSIDGKVDVVASFLPHKRKVHCK